MFCVIAGLALALLVGTAPEVGHLVMATMAAGDAPGTCAEFFACEVNNVLASCCCDCVI